MHAQHHKMTIFRVLFFLIFVLKVFGDINISTKIVGGTSVQSTTDYPYQVSLQSWGKWHFCGGSIIDRAWVLTAAHCVIEEIIEGPGSISFKVVASTIDRTNGVTKSVLLVKTHPQFNGAVNDIALIRINGVFAFTDSIKPIKLASVLPAPGTLATLTGWGDTTHNGVLSPIQLQVLFVQVIDLYQCQQKAYAGPVTKNNICTINTNGEGGCRGDSGGPLVYNGEQIGIVSFGAPKCASGYSDVDTSVPAFRNWISGITGIKV